MSYLKPSYTAVRVPLSLAESKESTEKSVKQEKPFTGPFPSSLSGSSFPREHRLSSPGQEHLFKRHY
jgi:hypothetical protein